MEYVNDLESFKKLIKNVKKAQEEYANFSQEKVDEIFKKVALKANSLRLPLARLAVEETGMGNVEDKVTKNHFASENIYNAYKNTKTCGVIEEDEINGIIKIVEPVGIVGAIIPTTNPTSTAIFKILLALKTRNAIILSPHPRAKNCTIETARKLLEEAIKAGAPENIIGWIDEPTLELTNEVMKNVDLILATGGTSMVKAAYSSGTPSLGVGPGNVPAIIDESADVVSSVNSVIHSKTFDNGMICASEQSIIVHESIYNDVRNELMRRNCYLLNEEQTGKLRNVILVNGSLNAKIVGQTAYNIAKLAGIEVNERTKVLVGEVSDTTQNEPFAHEKLSPVLAMYKAVSFDDAISKAKALIEGGGLGHTASIHINENEKEKIKKFASEMKASRIVVNTPSAFGGIGDIYNFKLAPSLTLGCGTWGGNSISENVGVKHLLNTKIVAERRKNMLWFRTPDKLYIKRGCLPFALDEIKDKKRAFIVTDEYLYNNGFTKVIEDKLNEHNITYKTFFNVMSDPTIGCAKEGAHEMDLFEPDVIIAIGGGSVMDAAKIMWVLYEHKDIEFEEMAIRFADIRKRIYEFPKMGDKAYFIAIPTSAGTGSEVTPFAVITDDETGIKYPLADYELMPNMAIVDVNLMMKSPKGLTAATGIDSLVHAIEAYVSTMVTDYTKGLCETAIKNIFEYLPSAYENGENDPVAREKMADAATIAGIAFANSFLGICHSMAHKLGAYFHLPHGIANAVLINEVIRYNAQDNFGRMGTFPEYEYPHAMDRYIEIANLLNVDGYNNEDKLNNLINKINDLKNKLEIKHTIRDYGIDEKEFLDKLDEMSMNAFDDQCTGTNPRYPSIEDIKEIYLKSYYGGTYELN